MSGALKSLLTSVWARELTRDQSPHLPWHDTVRREIGKEIVGHLACCIEVSLILGIMIH
jgi:hypothetical protein